MATYLDGNVRKATRNTVTAMKRSAVTRQCPQCGRKSALKFDADLRATYCRWGLETRYVTVQRGNVVGTRVVSLCDYYSSWDDRCGESAVTGEQAQP